MSAPNDPPHSQAAGAEPANGTVEVAAHRGNTLPVLAREARVLAPRPVPTPVAKGPSGVLIPIAQAAAAAAGGFAAGAALVGLARRRQRRVAAPRPRRAVRSVRRSQPGGRSPARPGELVHIVGSRSLLVDVHLLGER
jgi:hypothetical protein